MNALIKAHADNQLTLELVQQEFPDAIGFTVTEDNVLKCLYQNEDSRQPDWWREEVQM